MTRFAPTRAMRRRADAQHADYLAKAYAMPPVPPVALVCPECGGTKRTGHDKGCSLEGKTYLRGYGEKVAS